MRQGRMKKWKNKQNYFDQIKFKRLYKLKSPPDRLTCQEGFE